LRWGPSWHGDNGYGDPVNTVAKPCAVAICDDQTGFRRLVSLMLSLEPEVEIVGEAANGEEAIALVARVQPDVLLLDVAMPVMDGLEALPRIREVAPDTRVVMLTGISASTVRARALDGGAVCFIEKGTDVATIAQQVRDVCGGA
jgi:DNA-binding NarL/FixJ family response regulator